MSDKNIDRLIDNILIDSGAKKTIGAGANYQDWLRIDKWIERYFYLYDTAQLMPLENPQRNALIEATRRDDRGRFIYDTVIWSWIKKSGKTTVIAAVVDYFCSNKPRSRWRLVANDLKQADSRVGMYLRENILIGQNKGFPHNDAESSDFWQFRRDTEITDRGLKIIYPNGSIVEMIPVDPTGEAGGNDDGIVSSELWGWKSDKHVLMWSEMTISPNRFGYAQRWVDTYAGFTGESPVLEPLYNYVVKEENKIDIKHNPYCYANGGTFATWVEKPLLSWQTKEYYASERRVLSEMQFLRLHRNQWGTSEESFLDSDSWWHGCKRDDIPALNRFDEVIVALDAAVTNDCFGMVAVSRAPMDWQLKNGWKVSDDVFIVRYVQVWTPPKRGKIEFYGESNPEGALDRLTDDANVIQVAYDPYQLESFVSQQADKGGAWYEPFNQGGDRAKSDKFLYDTIREKRIIHAGEKDLTDHILNANKKTVGDRSIRLIKRADHLKIDLAVALSMALWRALEVIPK